MPSKSAKHCVFKRKCRFSQGVLRRKRCVKSHFPPVRRPPFCHYVALGWEPVYKYGNVTWRKLITKQPSLSWSLYEKEHFRHRPLHYYTGACSRGWNFYIGPNFTQNWSYLPQGLDNPCFRAQFSVKVDFHSYPIQNSRFWFWHHLMGEIK